MCIFYLHTLFSVFEQILALDISLRPEQITDLAQRISLTIESLTNIDAIIDATKNDLDLAVQLKGIVAYDCIICCFIYSLRVWISQLLLLFFYFIKTLVFMV